MSEDPLDSQEFHELCMDYRAASESYAQICFQRLQDFVRSKFIDIPKSAPDAQEREQVEAFIERAGFKWGYSELESWVRRMAEHAVKELAALHQAASEPTDAPYSHISPTSAFTVQATYEHTGKMKPRQFPDDEPTDALDAARYRWLRQQCWDNTLCVVTRPQTSIRAGSDCPTRGRLDAAIDAAMAERPAEGGSK